MNEQEMRDRIDELEDALHKIQTWTHAYPKDIFIEPTKDQWDRIHEALESVGSNSAAVHGSWARHITAGIRQICDGVLK